MGDFNDVVRESKDQKTEGSYGLGKHNKRSDKLVEFIK